MRRSTTGRRAKLTKRLQMQQGLTLTSMMDILTTLLLFVLKAFVAGGEVSTPPPGVTLPTSTAEATASSSVVVAIERDAIIVGGERVAVVSDVLADDGPAIPLLASRLVQERAQMDAIAERNPGDKPAARMVTIQGDREIEFRLLRKVMTTVHESGFEDVALAVLKRS